MNIKIVVDGIIFISLALIALGGLVHNTGSSLACPDWPLCFGQVFPEMKGSILIEHGHRLLASFVGLLTIVLVILSRRFDLARVHSQKYLQTQKQTRFFSLALLCLFLVIFQGVLGGLTVIFKLPTIISTLHLGFSMIFVGSLVYFREKLTFESWANKRNETDEKFKKVSLGNFRWNPWVFHLVFIGLATLYMQMLLGAFLRHSGAGVSCGLGFQNAFLCFDLATFTTTFWPSLLKSQVHFFHRVAGVFFLLFIPVIFLYLVKLKKDHQKIFQESSYFKGMYFLSGMACLLTLAQVTLGVLVVGLNISVIPTTLHLVGAALLFLVLLALFLRLKFLQQTYFTDQSHTWLSDLFHLMRPKLSILVVISAIVGTVLAPGFLTPLNFILFSLAFMLLVGGTCAINCYLERDVDKLMERTKSRPIPSGRISQTSGLVFGSTLVFISLMMLAYSTNILTVFLGAVGALIYLFLYTPMKRTSNWSLFIGAISGSLPPLMGWTAVTGTWGPAAFGLFLILFVWQLPHFLAIALYHQADYEKANIKILPTLKGLLTTKVHIFVYTLLLSVIAFYPLLLMELHSPSYAYVALALGAALLLVSLRGFFVEEKSQVERWARSYFWGTILYLPLLFAALMFFQ